MRRSGGFDGEGQSAASQKTRCNYRRLATTFDEAEVALNEGPGWIHQLVAATATPTRSMSIGTEIFNDEGTGDGFELVATE